MDKNEIKRRTGREAADALVRSGMKLGLGTGSTAVEMVRRIAEKLEAGELKDLLMVPTSLQTALECERLGLSLCSLNDGRLSGGLDLTIDGSDEVDPDWRLIKGGGAAMLMEKVAASASRRYAIVIGEGKRVQRLGERFPVPVEVLGGAVRPASRALEALGARVELRQGARKAGPVVTDNGHLILDAFFAEAFPAEEMERRIQLIPGVLANGIFTLAVTDLFIGRADGRVEHLRR
jgi:ribose 5-phosphate isomerase A